MCQNFYSVDKNLFWFVPPRVKRGKGSAEGIEEQRNPTLKMVDSAELAVYEYLTTICYFKNEYLQTSVENLRSF